MYYIRFLFFFVQELTCLPKIQSLKRDKNVYYSFNFKLKNNLDLDTLLFFIQDLNLKSHFYVLALEMNTSPGFLNCCYSNRDLSLGNERLFFLPCILLQYEVELCCGFVTESSWVNGTSYSSCSTYRPPWSCSCPFAVSPVSGLSKLCLLLFCLSDKALSSFLSLL